LDGGGVDAELVDTKRCSPSTLRQALGCALAGKVVKDEHQTEYTGAADLAGPFG